MTHLLLGLIGKKRSGKDTFAATLVEHRGFARMAFADPLKEALLHLDPYIGSKWDAFWHGRDVDDVEDVPRLSTLVDAEGWEGAKEWPEVRRLLQHYGMGIRAIDEGFWVNTTMERAGAHDGPVVITDVRLPNEAHAILDAGGTLVRIVRPGQTDSDTHISETALDEYHVPYTVTNDGSIADLAEKAFNLRF